MKVHYIHHSSYAVELDETILIFDYFRKDASQESEELVSALVSDTSKKLYVLNSHFHGDHYSDHIFAWAKEREVTYLLSKDIHVPVKTLGKYGFSDKKKPHIVTVAPYEERRIEDIRVETFKSTDIGVAFIVEAEGKLIYHAGDLHWWAWMDKGSAYVEHEGDIYKEQLAKMGNETLDIAFVVLDPRMGEGYAKGMTTFMETVGADMVFPMHLWGEYDLIGRYKALPEAAPFANRIVDIQKEAMTFEL